MKKRRSVDAIGRVEIPAVLVVIFRGGEIPPTRPKPIVLLVEYG